MHNVTISVQKLRDHTPPQTQEAGSLVYPAYM